MLDLVASQKLREPSTWELEQWRKAAKLDRRGWEDVFDGARYWWDKGDVLQTLEQAERFWCGTPGPSIGAGACPTELTRITAYMRRSLFSWLLWSSYTPNGAVTLVNAFPDFVLAPAAGGASDNAKSVDSSHQFSQGLDANKIAIPTAGAVFVGANYYLSSLSASTWSALVTANYSVYSAVSRGNGTASILSGCSTSGVHNYCWLNRTAAGDIGWSGYGGSGVSSASGLLPLSTVKSVAYEFTSATGVAQGYVSNSSVFSQAIGASGTTTSYAIGASAAGAGPMTATLYSWMFYKGVSSTIRSLAHRYAVLAHAAS